jgi:hypothetical protein
LSRPCSRLRTSELTGTQSQQRYQVSGFVEPAGQFGGREGQFVGLGDRLDLDLAIWACFANARVAAEQVAQQEIRKNRS